MDRLGADTLSSNFFLTFCLDPSTVPAYLAALFLLSFFLVLVFKVSKAFYA